MARFHIRATPPTSPLLFEYGRDFPGFIERYEYAQPMPWLADIARLERAWLDAYHAADRETLTSEALAAIPLDSLAAAIFCSAPGNQNFPLQFCGCFDFRRRTEPKHRLAVIEEIFTRSTLDNAPRSGRCRSAPS